MERPVSVLLVGIGGYGAKYVEHLLREGKDRNVFIAGAVDPYAESSKHYGTLMEMGVPVYKSMEEFYERHEADLAIISTPIHLHCEQTCLALERGSHVLCEKPAAATVQEVRKMIEYRDRYEKIVAIGYQWSYNPAVLKLKMDILSGKFGSPILLKTIVLWPRDTSYYGRSVWAGRLKIDGRWVLDSVANNATAHFLHNMLFVLGETLTDSARPLEVTAELYRVNRIESFDTCCMRIKTKRAEVLFYASHAVKERLDPVFEYQFEKAIVVSNHPSYPESFENIVVVYPDGRREIYGPTDHGSMRKLWVVIDAVRGKEEIICTLESAMAHTLVINGAHESMPNIKDFPEELKRVEGTPPLVWVEGLSEIMKKAYETEKLFSEMGVEWAEAGNRIDVRDYKEFKGCSL